MDTTEPDPEVIIRLGCKSGVPLAYMNLLSLGSRVEAASGGEKRVAGTEVGGAGFAGWLSRLA